MHIIGLVGGIASGKSLVAELLRERGAKVIQADQLGHVVLAEDADVQAALRSRWGDSIFMPGGGVDRSAVAKRVFAPGAQGTADRNFLEGLVHPRIRRQMEKQLADFAAAGEPATVIDAALLFEAGWDAACDAVVFIDSSRETRRQRARDRGWRCDDFDAREAAQMELAEKRRRANVVIENDSSTEDLSRAVQAFWAKHVSPRLSGSP